MAIIKTLAELRELFPRLLSSLSNQSTLPNFEKAAQKHLVPLIGTALLEEIETAYNADSLDADQVQLLKHMQSVAGSNALLDELAFSHATITDNGVRVATSQSMQKAVGWEYKELKQALETTALDSAEVLMQWLWDHKTDFPTWTASPQYRQFENCLLRTAFEFDAVYKLHQPFRTFYALKPILQHVQEFYLQAELGPDLLEHLRDAQNKSNTEVAALLMLKKALAFLAIKHACEHFAVQFDQYGFTVLSSVGESGATATPPALLKMKMDACDRDGVALLSKAKHTLVGYRKDTDASADFIAAFDASPLVNYVAPADRLTGNERYKGIFRFN